MQPTSNEPTPYEADVFWQLDGAYRIWRAGLPAVGPGERFRLVGFDIWGVYVRYLHDNEWGRDAGDFTLFISWPSVMAARRVDVEEGQNA